MDHWAKIECDLRDASSLLLITVILEVAAGGWCGGYTIEKGTEQNGGVSGCSSGTCVFKFPGNCASE